MVKHPETSNGTCKWEGITTPSSGETWGEDISVIVRAQGDLEMRRGRLPAGGTVG